MTSLASLQPLRSTVTFSLPEKSPPKLPHRSSATGLGSRFVNPLWSSPKFADLQPSISPERRRDLYRKAYVSAERRGAPCVWGGLDYLAKRPTTTARYMLPKSNSAPEFRSTLTPPSRRNNKSVRLLDDELRRKRLDQDRAVAAAERSRLEDAPTVVDKRLLIETQVMLRERVMDFDHARNDLSELAWLLDAHEFKQLVRQRVRPETTTKRIRLWCAHSALPCVAVGCLSQ